MLNWFKRFFNRRTRCGPNDLHVPAGVTAYVHAGTVIDNLTMRPGSNVYFHRPPERKVDKEKA